MSGEHSEYLEINGHRVPADQADRFRSGLDGSPLTDAQWDESKAREQADNIDLVPEEFRDA